MFQTPYTMPWLTHLDTKTAPRLTPMDRIIRYVFLPIVVAIGLHGLVHYAITGDDGTGSSATIKVQTD